MRTVPDAAKFAKSGFRSHQIENNNLCTLYYYYSLKEYILYISETYVIFDISNYGTDSVVAVPISNESPERNMPPRLKSSPEPVSLPSPYPIL